MTVHPEASIIPFNGKTPLIHPSAFIAPGCRIVGDVEIGEDASIWYNCVIRGDVNHVRIGARTNIQDGTVVHCDSAGDRADGRPADGWPTIIGEDVLIG
ncbi:MAG: gamma carbonic anhydrase family protein, partial [Pseudomonadota bacterium]|nr:gamma carbonic anhydrase family protein [Pseudomonadota bacterium]